MAVDTDSLASVIREVGLDAGLDAIAFASADPFASTRADLEQRKAEGLHGGMHFTYGDPATSTDPGRTLPGARSIVVGARSYRRAAPATEGGAPRARVARYSWSDHYVPLREALGRVAAVLEGEGFRTRVLVDDNALVDRAAAHRAGIGWYGKNTNLLLPGLGSWFVLGSVLTDAVLPAGTPIADGCGQCRRCIPACPTGALVAPGVLDARRCLAWLLEAPGDFPREFRIALGDRIYGCDDCQEVCPPNRAIDRDQPPPSADRAAEATVDVLALLGADDDDILRRYGRWYIPRRQARYVRRNALVVLGNIGDGDDPHVASALAAMLEHGDAMVRRHAIWAARRLGRDDLVAQALITEDDESVLAEAAAKLA